MQIERRRKERRGKKGTDEEWFSCPFETMYVHNKQPAAVRSLISVLKMGERKTYKTGCIRGMYFVCNECWLPYVGIFHVKLVKLVFSTHYMFRLCRYLLFLYYAL